MRMGFIAPVVRARSRGALTCTCGAPPNTVLKLTPRRSEGALPALGRLLIWVRPSSSIENDVHSPRRRSDVK